MRFANPVSSTSVAASLFMTGAIGVTAAYPPCSAMRAASASSVIRWLVIGVNVVPRCGLLMHQRCSSEELRRGSLQYADSSTRPEAARSSKVGVLTHVLPYALIAEVDSPSMVITTVLIV